MSESSQPVRPESVIMGRDRDVLNTILPFYVSAEGRVVDVEGCRVVGRAYIFGTSTLL